MRKYVRLIWWFAIAFLFLGLFVMTALENAQESRRNALETARIRAQAQAQLLAAEVTHSFRSVDVALSGLAEVIGSERRPMPHQQMHLEFHRRIMLLPYVRDMLLLGTDGSLRFKLRDAVQDPDPAILRQILLAHRDQWEEFMLTPLSDKKDHPLGKVLLSRSVHSVEGGFNGVLVATVDLSYLEEVLRDVKPAGLQGVVLVNGTRQVYTTWFTESRGPVYTIDDLPWFKAVPEKAFSFGGSHVYESADSMAGVHQLEGFPLYLAVAFDTATANYRWEEAKSQAILSASLASFICIVLFAISFRQSVQRRQAEDELLKSQERSKLTQMVREIAIGTGETRTLEDAVRVCLSRLSVYTGWPVGIALVDVKDADTPYIVWFCGDDLFVEARSILEHALNTSFVRDLERALWMDGLTAYRELFGESTDALGKLQTGCLTPFHTRDSNIVLGLFTDEDVEDDGVVSEVVQQVGALLVRVAEQKHAEEALRAQEELYRGMFEGIGFVELLVDPESGALLDVNSSAAEFYGYRREELVRMDFWGLHVTGESAVKPFIRQALRKGRAVFDSRQRMASGEIRDVEEHVSPVEYHGRRVILAIMYDVTTRKRVESQLARSEQMLRGIVERTPVALSITDQAGQYVYVNPAFCSMFGYLPDELLGNHFTLIVPETQKIQATRMHEQFLREGQDMPREWSCVGRNGNMLTVLLNGALVTSTTGLHQVAVFMVDITDRKQMEEMVIQNEKMASVGGLAAGMAHEINNPLGGILQGCQNINRRLSAELPANRTVAEEIGVSLEDILEYMDRRSILRFLGGIRESAERAARITSNMLDFSRRSNAAHTLTQLNDIIRKGIELALSDYDLNRHYDFKKITIEQNFDEHLEPVNCLDTEIEQVVINLLRNAAQAMFEAQNPPDVPTITVHTYNKEGGAVFEIADNGPGMPPEVARRAFEPFYTTRRANSGSGLGLAVSYFIVTNNHGGKVYVDSAPGKGTRVTVFLPYEQVSGGEDEPAGEEV